MGILVISVTEARKVSATHLLMVRVLTATKESESTFVRRIKFRHRLDFNAVSQSRSLADLCLCCEHRAGGIIPLGHLPRVVLALLLLILLLIHVLCSEACCGRALIRVSLVGAVFSVVIVFTVPPLTFRWFCLYVDWGQIGFLLLWERDAFNKYMGGLQQPGKKIRIFKSYSI